MPRIAIFGGTGYLASIIKNQNYSKKNKYIFFSRKKNSKNYINFSNIKKDKSIFKNIDLIIHLIGPSQNQIKRNLYLGNDKKQITTQICDLCIAHNIKLIYISSMQVYKNYGKSNLSTNSIINLNSLYAKSHFDSEKIIKKKFLNYKHMYTILRMGNVFGFKNYVNIRELNNNIIHGLCNSAIQKKKIIIKNGGTQRTFIPSKIFINVINYTIQKKIFNNSIINIAYKNYNLKDVALIIKKRFKLIFNLDIKINIETFNYKKKFSVYSNKKYRFKFFVEKIYDEIDQILMNIK
jgi:nucleoside-diphosphate-sugar epimerase